MGRGRLDGVLECSGGDPSLTAKLSDAGAVVVGFAENNRPLIYSRGFIFIVRRALCVLVITACGSEPPTIDLAGEYAGMIGAASVSVPPSEAATARFGQQDRSFTGSILASNITYDISGVAVDGTTDSFETTLGGSQTFAPGLCPIHVSGTVRFNRTKDDHLRLTGTMVGLDCHGDFLVSLDLLSVSPLAAPSIQGMLTP